MYYVVVKSRKRDDEVVGVLTSPGRGISLFNGSDWFFNIVSKPEYETLLAFGIPLLTMTDAAKHVFS